MRGVAAVLGAAAELQPKKRRAYRPAEPAGLRRKRYRRHYVTKQYTGVPKVYVGTARDAVLVKNSKRSNESLSLQSPRAYIGTRISLTTASDTKWSICVVKPRIVSFRPGSNVLDFAFAPVLGQ